MYIFLNNEQINTRYPVTKNQSINQLEKWVLQD